jgi:4-hydroxy-tetrahydrodipicolinate synthase
MPVEGLLPVIPTPFLDGAFDASSFQRLLDHMLPFVDGYTLLGSTGEAPSLTDDQRREITERALAMTPSDKLVVVGVSHTSAKGAAELSRHAQDHGGGAVLCAVPYYYANTSSGVAAFLRELDAALSVDLVLYDNPVATKTVLAADDVIAWGGECEHLTAAKLTDHNLAKIEQWQHAGLRVLAGDDSIIMRYIAAGVDGAMVIAPAMFPEVFQEVWRLLRGGNPVEALRIAGERMLPFLHVFGIGDEIPATKALFADIGVFASDEVLPPLTAVSAERRALLRQANEAMTARAGPRTSEGVASGS